MNNSFQLIKDFLSEKTSAKNFFEQVYTNKELQHELEQENDINPFTKDGSLFIYLATIEPTQYQFIWDAKEALSKFLSKRDIEFNVENTEAKLYDIASKVTPKWLEPPVEYLRETIIKNEGLNDGELKRILKEKILSEFVFIKAFPKWLQSPNWPIENGIPLTFVGEIDISSIEHDTTKVFVFYDKKNSNFKNIKQSM